MKKGILWWGVILMGFSHAMAQRAGVATNLSLSVTNFLPIRLEYDQQAEKGPHHHRVTHVKQSVNGFGQILSVTNSYVELATGMHYRDEKGEWQPTEEKIELINGLAVARKGPHKVIFNPNPNVIGAVDLETPDGKRLRSHVLGLSLYDPVTGQGETIATLKDVTGELVAANQILYPDAFDGIKADLRYTYTASGLEQDVILREQIDLADYDIGTARLEVVTEFDEIPTPAVTTRVLRRESDAGTRAGMADPDFTDVQLDFGGMSISQGQAFDLSAEGGQRPEGVPVGKRFETIDNRNILYEQIELNRLETEMETLPAAKPRAGVNSAGKTKRLLAKMFPPRASAGKTIAKGGPASIRLAQADYRRQSGVVIDYTILSATTDLTLQGDTTYYVTNTVVLYGTTILEGGAVIKYDTNTTATIRINEVIDCRTSTYRPAIFTGRDDDTTGATISTSTGSPQRGGYGTEGALSFTGGNGDIELAYLHVNYVRNGIKFNSSGKHRLSHSQFTKNQYAILKYASGDLLVNNCLVDQVDTVFQHDAGGIRGANLTLHRANYLKNEPSGAMGAYLTNCLAIGITNFPGASSISFYNSATNASDMPSLFQTVGGGEHYLAAGSPYRNYGTTNIDGSTLSALRRMTTYPPLNLSNITISVDTTFPPQAQRDTDTVDIGYHYLPLDYLVSVISVTNATLLATNGVAVGVYGTLGFSIHNNAKLISEGHADAMNVFARYYLSQENRFENDPSDFTLIGGGVDESQNREFHLRFTRASVISRGTHYRTLHTPYYCPVSVSLKDSEIAGGYCVIYSLTSSGGDLSNSITNCLFQRASAYFEGKTTTLFNNTFIGGTFDLVNFTNETYTVKDNFFDRCPANCLTGGTLSMDYNGYVTGYSRLSPNGAHDVILGSSPNYYASCFGNYYLPPSSALIDAGSRSATNASLYHYTTQSTQTKDTNTVDIGFHYVAATISPALDTVWVEDSVPGGASTYIDSDGHGPNDTWSWASSSPAPFSGSSYHYSLNSATTHQHYFIYATNKLAAGNWSTLVCYVYLDPSNPPGEIMLQWLADDATSWAHRAYWGTDYITFWGTRTYMGAIPATGQWVRLEVPATAVNMAGRTANGMAYTLYNGKVSWDHAGRFSFSALTPGVPLDTDGDGFPDYIEDRNGNGSVDSGETNWNSATDLGLKVVITRPRNNTQLP